MFREIIFLICIATVVFTDEKCETETPPCAVCKKSYWSWPPSICECPGGYKVDGENCKDENECENSDKHDCDQNCTNTVGSYECSCNKADYVLQDDKRTCKKTTDNESEDSQQSLETNQTSITKSTTTTEAAATTTDAETTDAASTTTTASTTINSITEALTDPSSEKSDQLGEEAESKESIRTQPQNIEFANYGYNIDSFHAKEDAENNEVLYFSVSDEIKAYSLADKNTRLIIGSLEQAKSLTINGNDLFWSETGLGKQKIVRSTIRGTEARLYVLPNNYSGLISAEEVKVDWITGNMYYVDHTVRQIGACSPYGTQCTALVRRNVINPRSITLNPQRGEMYWSDWGAPAKISRASMDGTQESSFVSTNIVHPQGLTIDYPEQTLYWTDFSTRSLNRIMLNGNGRRVLLELLEQFHPFSLAVHGNLLYWSDIRGKSIMSCNKNTGGNLQNVVQEKEKFIYGISIYVPDQESYKSIPNPCSMSRQCEDLCLLKEEQGYSCACFQNRILKNDLKSCEYHKQIITSDYFQKCGEKEFRCKTGKCISRSLECDRIPNCEDSSDEHGRCASTDETAKNSPSSISSNLPCTVNNMPHNYLILNNSVYDVDRNTRVQLEAQNVEHVSVYPGKYASAYIDSNKNLILDFKQINEKEEPSKSVETYYYSLTLRLSCFNGAKVNMFTKVPLIDTNTFDPVFEKPSYTFQLISTIASDFEMVQKLNRIVAIDHDVTNGELDFSMSKNEYFDVVYDGVVPNSLGKKHYAKLIPKASEIRRNVYTEIYVADSGNPKRTGRARLNILLLSSAVPIFTKSIYTGHYYANTNKLRMEENPKLQDRANFGSMAFALKPSNYFTLSQNGDELIISLRQPIPYSVTDTNTYMALELRAGDANNYYYLGDSNSKTVIIINIHQ